MKNLRYLCSALGFMLLYACGSSKSHQSTIHPRLREHKTIAVLPYEVINSGKAPEGLTDAQKKQIEEDEVKLFQQSLYNAVSSRMGRSGVQVQLSNKTNNILRDKGIALTEVGRKNPEDLAKMLGVDAVVFATVTKYRYMDEKASMKIGLTKTALSQATGGASNMFTRGVSNKTNDVKLTCVIVDALTGEVVWRKNADTEADWTRTPNQMVDALNFGIMLVFPYQYLEVNKPVK